MGSSDSIREPAPPKPWEGGSHAEPTMQSATVDTKNEGTAAAASESTPNVPQRTYRALNNNPNPLVNPGMSMYNNPYSYGYGSSPYSGYGHDGYSGLGSAGYSGYGMNTYSGYNPGGYYSSYGNGGLYGNSFGGMYGSSAYQQPGTAGPHSLPLLHTPLQTLSLLLSATSQITQLLDMTLHTTHNTLGAFGELRNMYGRMAGGVGSFFGGLFGSDRNGKSSDLSSNNLLKHKESDLSSHLVRAFKDDQFANNGRRRYRFTSPLFIISSAVLIYHIFGPWISHIIREKLRKRNQDAISAETFTMESPFEPSIPQKAMIRFAQALYDYTPPIEAQNDEISFKKGDIIAIVEMGSIPSSSNNIDPKASNSNATMGWWRGKLKNGPIGYFPSNYVKLLDKSIEIDLGGPENKGSGDKGDTTNTDFPIEE